jgi:RNA polymerase sigma factor (sigma-70 family)
MSEDAAFDDLIRRLRAGDEDAFNEFDRKQRPELRKRIRDCFLQYSPLKHVNSEEICQEVLASFCCRVRLGQYDLPSPGHLARLLLAMARHKFLHRVREQQRRPRTVEADPDQVPAREPTPSMDLVVRELLEKARARFTPDEWQLAELRRDGRSWAEIAAQVGGSPEALRKKHDRAVDRVLNELGLGGGGA